MSSESLTLKWLRQNIQPYAHSDRVFADVETVLRRNPTLRPKTDIYTFDDGRTQLLLCLHGLLPITYRQSSYHIPVAIWVTREYPRAPPLAYVVPTSDMLVRPGKYMDVSGKANIEYLQHWERKSEGCDLASLVEAMQSYFSTEPPVYAKPKQPSLSQAQPPPQAQPSPSSAYASRPPPPIPPLPIQAASATPSPPIAQSSRPTLPPKPTASIPTTALMGIIPPQSPPSWHLPGSVPGPAHRYSHPPNPPPIPSLPSAAIPTSTAPTASPGPISPPPFYPYAHPPAPPAPQLLSPAPAPPPNFLDEESLDDPPVRAAVAFAAAPPRPPNPELLSLHARVHAKVTSELASLAQAMALDAKRLRAHQTDLLAGEPAVRDEMARLEAVRDVCRGVAGRLRGTVELAEKNVAELKRKGDPPVDELVCSTSIVHNQLIDLIAEDNAIEDTVYHLHRALNAGRMDLDRFLRTTRVLAEEQFMKRALIEKIQAALPMGAQLAAGWA
ncbi:UEV-domain-containing protein [Artomyces pyxidatus]|uniref:UEV-domain-containing protein n=1 Tax=Artomyces pyxidatus TaxID=48021 RepID=A0ACB8T6V9_9AGAM|nr:UEV-domain-containing protein [Artomyces pyxidatus]